MNIVNIINKKRMGISLTDEEIEYVIKNYLNEKIKDYQMSSLLMAICINGMNEEETISLTKYMLESGESLDLSSLKTKVIDKHSTGGVGDKTTLIIAPLVASCGVSVAKMSGRSLGITGGTIDKLESIPGFKVNLSDEEFLNQVKNIGVSIVSQTQNLVPADKKIYALRDDTGTVESIPLIASSVMSKKLASGSDGIVIDVKVGLGAHIKNIEECRMLAKLMIEIGKSHNKEIICILTNMDIPLGFNIGNSLEIEEAIDVLNNEGEPRLTELCIYLATYMVMLGKNISFEEANLLVKSNLSNGKAYAKFKELISAQGGNLDKLPTSKYKYEIKSELCGFLTDINALNIANYIMKLGAGRENKDDVIDYSVGIHITKNLNDYINAEDVIAVLHTNNEINDIDELLESFFITSNKNDNIPLIYEIIK